MAAVHRERARVAGHSVRPLPGRDADRPSGPGRRARVFYLHQAEFEPSPTDPLHLFLLISDLLRALGSQSPER